MGIYGGEAYLTHITMDGDFPEPIAVVAATRVVDGSGTAILDSTNRGTACTET